MQKDQYGSVQCTIKAEIKSIWSDIIKENSNMNSASVDQVEETVESQSSLKTKQPKILSFMAQKMRETMKHMVSLVTSFLTFQKEFQSLCSVQIISTKWIAKFNIKGVVIICTLLLIDFEEKQAHKNTVVS